VTATWFIFDLGNTLIKLAYERVLENIRKAAPISRDDLIEVLEGAGGYRDMERGFVNFSEFYDFICEKAGYRGTEREFHALWTDFFDGTMPGAEDLLERVREKYRVAFLSNSNEVHAEVIPRAFSNLFRKDDRFIYSYRYKCAKPDPEIFNRTLEIIGALPQHAVYIDDLVENVIAARSLGMRAFQFRDTVSLLRELEQEELLESRRTDR
jgi:putative hydrolase of the HAD superfamily